MTTRAFQKIYTKIDNITKATVTLRAQGVGNDELATVGGKLAQVVKIMGENVTLQVFAGTEGLATDSEVVFHGEPPKLRVSDNLAGRFFNAYGEPLEGGEIVEGEAREIGGPTVNPYRRIQPSELIATGIAGIDLNNTIVTGQKIPFFADPDQPYNAVMANVALRAKADKIILGGMGLLEGKKATCYPGMEDGMTEASDNIDARIAELEAAEQGGRDFEVLNSQLAANERRVHPSSGPRDYVAPDDEDDEEEDDGPDDAGELDELEHMRDVADMAYAALSDLALHCHNRREDVAWGIASSAAKDAHVLATFVGDWIEDMEDED